MSNVKITDLPSLTGESAASTDVLPVVSVSADTTSKMTRAEFFQNVPAITTTGNVGIGTTSPSSALSIYRAGTAGIDMVHATGATGSLAAAASSVFMGSFSNHPVLLYANSSEAMRITSSGNVGIGITSPYGTLTVGQGVQPSGSSPSSKPNIEIWQGSNTVNDAGGIDLRGSASGLGYGWRITALDSTGVHLVFANRSNSATYTEQMRITSAGNVGIGTNNPTVALDVLSDGLIARFKSSTSTTAYIRFDGTGSSFPYIGLLSGIGTFGNTDASPIRFNTNSQERMRILSDGKIGVGTTAPVTDFQVAGDTITTGVVYKAQPTQTSKSSAVTLTIAELLTGIVQWTGAALTLTLPTGTSIEGGLPATFPINMSFDVSFINTGSGTLTIGANSNTTVGLLTVATSNSGIFRFRKTATNTYTIYRIS